MSTYKWYSLHIWLKVISGTMYWLGGCKPPSLRSSTLGGHHLRNFLNYCSVLSWLDLRIGGCPRSTPSNFWDNWGPINLFPNIHRYMRVLNIGMGSALDRYWLCGLECLKVVELTFQLAWHSYQMGRVEGFVVFCSQWWISVDYLLMGQTRCN